MASDLCCNTWHAISFCSAFLKVNIPISFIISYVFLRTKESLPWALLWDIHKLLFVIDFYESQVSLWNGWSVIEGRENSFTARTILTKHIDILYWFLLLIILKERKYFAKKTLFILSRYPRRLSIPHSFFFALFFLRWYFHNYLHKFYHNSTYR